MRRQCRRSTGESIVVERNGGGPEQSERSEVQDDEAPAYLDKSDWGTPLRNLLIAVA